MKPFLTTVLVAFAVALPFAGTATATPATIEDRVAALETRVTALETQVTALHAINNRLNFIIQDLAIADGRMDWRVALIQEDVRVLKLNVFAYIRPLLKRQANSIRGLVVWGKVNAHAHP